MPKSASAESLHVARFLLEAGGRDSQSKATKVFMRQECLAKKRAQECENCPRSVQASGPSENYRQCSPTINT
jgi:hypothetical protein